MGRVPFSRGISLKGAPGMRGAEWCQHSLDWGARTLCCTQTAGLVGSCQSRHCRKSVLRLLGDHCSGGL